MYSYKSVHEHVCHNCIVQVIGFTIMQITCILVIKCMLQCFIKRVQGCSQSDALKWVTCALFIFSLTCTECKKCAAKKHNCTALRVILCRFVFAMQNATHSHAATACMQCIWRAALVYLFTFFNLFVGLFGIITFDPFYKTNNTLISECISGVATWFRTFTMLCKPNSPGPPPPPGSFGSHHCKCPQCMLHCR